MRDMSPTTNSKPTSASFWGYLNFNLRMLRIYGVELPKEGRLRGDEAFSLAFSTSSQIWFGVALVSNIATSLLSVYQINWMAGDAQGNPDVLTDIATGLLSNAVCVVKCFTMMYQRREIANVILHLSELWTEVQHFNWARAHARLGLGFCKFYLVAVIGLDILWATAAYIFYFQMEPIDGVYSNENILFPLKYPWQIRSLWHYQLLLIHESWLLIFDSLSWYCCDALFVQLTTHLAVHFLQLRRNIELAGSPEAGLKFSADIRRLVERHRELLRICDVLQKLFEGVVFVAVSTTALSMCVNLFQIEKQITEGQYEKAAPRCFHLVNLFFQLLVYCKFNDLLTEHNSLVTESAWSSQWWGEDAGRDGWFCQMMIMRAQRPFTLTAYGIFHLTYEQMTKICKTAVSFYMLLRTTRD